uniref:Uncharacterized protein n=1 Tax=Stropharia rugosoannulata TaxID=68746 RepID=A0A3G9HFC0_9AGAR|nr:hypothetical protein [Stropharia rugosoannulata]
MLDILNSETIFDIAHSIFNRITNGEVSLGDNPMSVYLLDLIRQSSGNHPYVESVVAGISNSAYPSHSVILDQLWGGEWRSITLGNLFDVFCDMPLEVLPPYEFVVQPLTVISFGLVYSLMIRSYAKHMINPEYKALLKGARKIFLPNIRIHNSVLGIFCLFIAPVSAITICAFKDKVLGKSISLNFGYNNVSSNAVDELFYWPSKST